MTVWAGRHVVLGVSGGIACYKSCIIARRLTEAGAQVDAVLTQGAAEFVRPLTFEALTGRPVLSSIWEQGGALSHVRLGREADLVLVAPATAHLIARMAQGMADDLLTALLLAMAEDEERHAEDDAGGGEDTPQQVLADVRPTDQPQ